MKCHEFEDRLNDLQDERKSLRQDSAIAAHAAQCEACSQVLEGQLALLAGLANLPTPSLGADFAERVVAEANLPVEAVVVGSQGRSWWWIVGGLAALAATLLLAVNIAFVANRNRDRGANLANQSPAAPAPLRREAKPRPRGLATIIPGPASPRPAAPNRQPPALAREPAPQLPDPLVPALTRPFSAYGLSLESMAANLPEAVEQLEEVERIAPGFRPIRLSFAMLWGALRRAIPGLHSTEEVPTNTSGALLESWRVA